MTRGMTLRFPDATYNEMFTTLHTMDVMYNSIFQGVNNYLKVKIKKVFIQSLILLLCSVAATFPLSSMEALFLILTNHKLTFICINI